MQIEAKTRNNGRKTIRQDKISFYHEYSYYSLCESQNKHIYYL